MEYHIDDQADADSLPAAVRKGIREADPGALGGRDWQPIHLSLKDDAGNVAGGLYGATMWSWLMIDGLWISPSLRGRGLGKKLLLAAEAIATGRGCTGSWLGTFGFQARDFYEHLGYRVFAELPGFPPGHTHFHLSKALLSGREEGAQPSPDTPSGAIREATPTDTAGWLRLREMLWPGADHQTDIARHFDEPAPGITLVAEDSSGKIIAFAEVSVRTDWVDGATTSPTAFLEGIFVDPAARGTGIARSLVSAAVDWTRNKGYRELGSNTDIGNKDAIAFHLACGFREAERNVAFIMSCHQHPPI